MHFNLLCVDFCRREWVERKKIAWSESLAERGAANNIHWPGIRTLIMVLSDASSTSGMSNSVAASELLKHRSKNVVPNQITRM